MLVRAGVALLAVAAVLGHPGPYADDVGLSSAHTVTESSMASFVASVFSDNYYLCGGSVIHPQFVLTVAQCCHLTGKYQVSFGALKMYTDNISPAFTEVDQVMIHPKFDASTLRHDVSLLKLNASLEWSATVGPIALYSDQVLPNGVIVMGWSHQPEHNEPQKSVPLELHYLYVKIIHSEQCSRTYNSFEKVFPPAMFCARAGAVISEIGGPAIISGDNWKLVGMVSSIDFPAQRFPRVGTRFTNLAPYASWINTTMIDMLNLSLNTTKH